MAKASLTVVPAEPGQSRYAALAAALKARVVSCVFEELRGGKYKIISFSAKRARGLMARYAIEHKAGTVNKLQAFDAEGYAFDVKASSPDRLVFRRKQPA